MTFADELRDWTDSDVACWLLGKQLSVLEGDFIQNKGKFWTDNRLGNGLYAALLALVDAGVLERDEAEERFRWSLGNPSS